MAAVKKTTYNFEKICRVCLQVKREMRPLFEQLTATMLMEISKVQVAVGDGLPAQLCLQCVQQISRNNAFKGMVERNDIVLREQKARDDDLLKSIHADGTISIQCSETGTFLKFDDTGLSSNQILEGFFTVPLQTNQEINKNDFEMEKIQPETKAEQKDENEALNSDEENYLQMVVFQSNNLVGPGRHMCNLCHKEFKHARWLKLHMRSHSNWIKANCKKPPMCPICDRTFKGQGMLKMHMRTHEDRPPKQPTCSVCQRTFPTKTLLYRHRQTHFEQKSHQCTVCEKRFFSAYALRSHMARHRGERPYVCAVCSKTFYNPTDLKVHFRMHTGEKPLKCSECNKAFRRHSTLCQHMKKHRGIRNHVCNICNKAFYEVSKLNAHMRVHTGEKPFECQFCTRKFTQLSALIYHRRTHTGEKPYCCKVCPAKFTTSSARNNHLLTHTGLKKFVCPVCLKGCSSRTELRVHSSKHTGEKLFGCETCSQRFSSASYLAVHRRSHNTEIKYHCNICDKGFTDSNAYKKHLKTHTKDKGTDNSTEVTQEVKINMDKEVPEIEQVDEQEDTQTQVTEAQGESAQKRYRCGLCVKSYTYLHSLKRHMLTHVQMCVYNTDVSEKMYAFKQQQVQQEQQQVAQLQPQQLQQVLQVGSVQQLAVPLQHVQQGLAVSGVQTVQQPYPVMSTVQSLQLQQTQQHNNGQQPQPLQVQTIQIHPHHQPIQIHTVGVQQVQQEQLHVATSSCQTMLPNILQLQPGTVVSGLGQQDLSGVAHRIILQQQPGHPSHPAVYTIHH
ncbi:zinc finger protein 431-like isoform X2 [Leptidea sinapis]|uniref:zinc finger protein 431-like isoform X2 n=1 Tax=Leptidea sinapis TaxID=189913 RepID=UPI0021C4BA52|nr:zinc finger protein 431-like isoform X2 [Leptidea sinapis]